MAGNNPGFVFTSTILLLFKMPGEFLRVRSDMKRTDRSALDEMVAGARARVTDFDGRLLHGINGESLKDGEESLFTAKAVSPYGEHEDYASFVEYGHAGRGGGSVGDGAGPVVADDHYFERTDGAAALPARQPRKTYDRHLGITGFAARKVDPHPFFNPAAVGPLEQRARQVETILDNFFYALTGEQ